MFLCLGEDTKNAICKISWRCPRRNVGACLYWYDIQIRCRRRAVQGSDRCVAQGHGEIQRLQGCGTRSLSIDRGLRALLRRENGRPHALPQRGNGRTLCQSYDPRRARPDEAKRLALRTRGQGVTAGWGRMACAFGRKNQEAAFSLRQTLRWSDGRTRAPYSKTVRPL